MKEMVLKALRARFSDLDFCLSSPVAFFRRPLIRLPMERTKSAFVDVLVVVVTSAVVAVDVSVTVVAIESLTIPSIDCWFCCCVVGGRPLVFNGTAPLVPVPLLEPKELSSLTPFELGVGANVTLGTGAGLVGGRGWVNAKGKPNESVELAIDS